MPLPYLYTLQVDQVLDGELPDTPLSFQSTGGYAKGYTAIWFFQGKKDQGYRLVGDRPLSDFETVQEMIKNKNWGEFYEAALTFLTAQGPFHHGLWNHLSTPELRQVFPAFQFYTLHFRQHPIANLIPLGHPLLKAHWNLVVVNADKQVSVITDDTGLKHFFLKEVKLPAAGGDRDLAEVKPVLLAWVELAEAIIQDDFLHDVMEMKRAEVQRSKFDSEVSGSDHEQFFTCRVPAQERDPLGGHYEVFMNISRHGRISSIESRSTLRNEGPRPVCQALRLLDADPAVRRWAEHQILQMGRWGLPYLEDTLRYRVTEGPLRVAIERVYRRLKEAASQ